MKKVLYGIGGLSYSVISQTMSNFFMFFATSVLGLSGSLVGVAIAISTIWDGISDTFVGYLSDTKPLGRLGKRNGYMLIACIGMSIVNIFVWFVPGNTSIVLKFVWILVSLILLETFNTMFSTPYMALGNELATSDNDRTKINACNTIFFLIGIIIPSVLMLIFLKNTDEYPQGQLNPLGYKYIAIVTSIICLICGIISSLFTRNKNSCLLEKSKKFSIKEIFKNYSIAFRDKKLLKLILGYVFTSISTVFLCSVGLHFFTYSFFYKSNQITFLLLTLILGTILSQPLWVYLSKKNKKKPALIGGIILTILSVFAVIFIYLFRIEIYKISYVFMLIVIFICGVGSGALYSLPSSIYGDYIMTLKKPGNDLTATYSGTLTFAGNIANSITQLIVGVLLDIIKFDASVLTQTLSVQTGLALILFIGIQVSLIFACSIFVRIGDK